MREKWIDNAKGLAILLVILGHVGKGLAPVLDVNFVYGIHLTVFFLISGYTMKQKPFTKTYIAQKFFRLMTPYFITCFAVMLMDVINSFFIKKDGSLAGITRIISRDLLRGFFASGSVSRFGDAELGTRIGAIWFLPALFFAVVLFQFLLNHIHDKRLLGWITAGVAVAGWLSARFLWFPFSVQAGMISVFFLWIGYEVKQRSLLQKIKWYHYLLALLTVIGGAHHGYCNIGFVSANLADPLLSVIVGIAGALLVYGISVINRRGVILSAIGKISLTVMCTHLFALETMGPHIDRLLNRLPVEGITRSAVLIGTEMLFAVLTAFMLEGGKRLLLPLRDSLQRTIQAKTSQKRDPTVDVAKGVFMIAMLVGHFAIDSQLRAVIYSCHMMGFVLLSGYFYRSGQSFKSTLQKTAKGFLLPYGIFVGLALGLRVANWTPTFLKNSLIQYTVGLSFAKKWFPHVASVGPMYFVLMLFVIRWLYQLVDRVCHTQKQRWGAVLILSLIGYWMGKNLCWAPWSIDIALYGLIFYQIGRSFRTYQVPEAVSRYPFVYFLLAPLWIYMINKGSMEIAVRNYGSYGLVILGAAAGTLVVYQLSAYITARLPLCRMILQATGRYSIVLLIVHTLWNGTVKEWLQHRFHPDGFPLAVFTIVIQVLAAVVIGWLLGLIKSHLFRKKSAQ